MNVSNSSPHILLFERDQQLTALFTSEFQLAGYECHAARTAVEVFDTIARYAIRLLLVNLAQAAAGRREFWVALDAQRRARGVQVFTYRCINLAGYGPEDPDERGRSAQADMEVVGMSGIVNLVAAIRARVPTSTIDSLSRVAKAPVADTQTAGPAGMSETAMIRPAVTADPTIPLPVLSSGSQPAMFAAPPMFARQQPPAAQPPAPRQQSPAWPTPVEPPGSTIQSHTDRIRAIIYPNQRVWSPSSPSPLNSAGAAAQHGDSSSSMMESDAYAPRINVAVPATPPFSTAGRQAMAHETPGTSWQSMQSVSPEQGEESSLAQLSRLLREQHAPQPVQENGVQRVRQEPQERPVSTEGQVGMEVTRPPFTNASSLRASPIQDMPLERTGGAQYPAASTQSPAPVRPVPASPMISSSPQTMGYHDTDSGTTSKRYAISASEEGHHESTHLGLIQASIQGALRRHQGEVDITSDNTLLDIMQSLPPMPSPPPPPSPPVLSGRATRSLGSVLLEGHLVPQNRLEVAQNVQRMLRGVDLNYHLGEILLMFKLLTPDQLLAATLVSYGLISTTQISALGRIRQELHAIGLEYDLENLLILFRILTPEQLREVRADWT